MYYYDNKIVSYATLLPKSVCQLKVQPQSTLAMRLCSGSSGLRRAFCTIGASFSKV